MMNGDLDLARYEVSHLHYNAQKMIITHLGPANFPLIGPYSIIFTMTVSYYHVAQLISSENV
jgi:hypothetical protein